MKRRGVLLVAAVAAFAGCGGPSLLDQVRQLRTFTRCQFRLVSAEGTTLAGVPIQGKTALREVGALDAIRLGLALKSGPLPLSFQLNIEAKNPNTETAAMNRFSWTLFVDGQQLTTGTLEQRVEIAGGGAVTTFPLTIAVDLRAALPGQTRDALLNLAFNVAGAGAHPTKLTLHATPTIIIAGIPMEFRDAVNVSTEFGGN